MIASARSLNVFAGVLAGLLLAATAAFVPAAPAASPEVAPAAPPAGPAAAAAETAPSQVRKAAAETVRTISFRLKDGRAVSGRVLNEDRAQVTIAEPVGGTLQTATYSRGDFEPRSISYQTINEYQYWLNTGQYFESRTWDFKDDADEFAQAVRCYQTAYNIAVGAMGKDSAIALEAEGRVKKAVEARQQWMDVAKPRAQMAEMEFKSTLAQKLDELNRAVQACRNDIDRLSQSQVADRADLRRYQREMDSRLQRMAEDIRRTHDYIRGTGLYPLQPGVTVTPGSAPR
jgi:hypothetical protein